MGFNIERADKPFVVKSPYKPSGDQPQAIAELAERIENGENDVVLMGATGTGKTATTAWLIEKLQRPTLIIEPNKTLAAQLCAEFRELMPDNAVSYFVSYYDYYQPEAYIPQTDTYIEKDSNINDDVERLRHQATANLLTRRDCVVVATVSCIYGWADNLFDHPIGQSHLIVAWRGGQVHGLADALQEFRPFEWSVVHRGGQAEAVFDQRALAGGIALVHGTDLRHSDV